MNRTVKLLAGVLMGSFVGAGLAGTGQSVYAAAPAVWQDPGQSVDARAADLLGRLTLEEKIGLVHADGSFSVAGLPRFGIGKLWTSDGPQGVREETEPNNFNGANRTDDFATAMPANIALAATFDPAMAYRYAEVLAKEARLRGKHILLGPGLNIMRTPLNGRNNEYQGEDPWLASRMGVALVKGLQDNGVAACVKHYALNNQEVQRGRINVVIDDRTLHEIYLPAFKAAVKEGKAWSVMTAYNLVNGQYCSENAMLLNDVLKRDWKFPGVAMTDWGGTHSTIDAAMNGLDLEMGTNIDKDHANDFFATPYLQAIKDKKVPESRLNDSALRVLRVMAFAGLLDPTPREKPATTMMAPEHLKVAREVAAAGCVLLKNDNAVLPIDSTKIKTLGVVGLNAEIKYARDGGSAKIKTKDEVTILKGIQDRAGKDLRVLYARGYARPTAGKKTAAVGGVEGEEAAQGDKPDPALIAEAVEVAKKSDLVLIVGGLFRRQDKEGVDRANMDLPVGQAELIAAVNRVNKKSVVVLVGGGPMVVEPWLNDTAGLLMYWYGIGQGGNGLADVLFGDVNPSGRLPCSWPKSMTDSPAHAANDVKQYPGVPLPRPKGPKAGQMAGFEVTYSEGPLVGYRWFDAKKIEPQFPFGFGLSYTTFAMSDLALTPISGHGADVTATVRVTNTGPRAGSEVVQLYVGPINPNPAFPRPPRELKGFAKVFLQPGESSEVRISLNRSAFAYYDPAKRAWVTEAGGYAIEAGNSSRELHLRANVILPQTSTYSDAEGN